jgi:hypothetical protein
LWKKAHWEFGQGQVEVPLGNLVEDPLGEGGRGLGGGGARGPENDIQLGWTCGSDEVRGLLEVLMQFKCGGATGFEALGKSSAGYVGEQLLCSP